MTADVLHYKNPELTKEIHEKTFNDLEAISWTMWVERIKKAVGIQNRVLLLNKETRTAPGSTAFILGHKKLGEFIESPRSEGGVDSKWDDWEAKYKALCYKYDFRMIEADANDILLKINRAKKILGRMPASSGELEVVVETEVQTTQVMQAPLAKLDTPLIASLIDRLKKKNAEAGNVSAAKSAEFDGEAAGDGRWAKRYFSLEIESKGRQSSYESRISDIEKKFAAEKEKEALRKKNLILEVHKRGVEIEELKSVLSFAKMKMGILAKQNKTLIAGFDVDSAREMTQLKNDNITLRNNSLVMAKKIGDLETHNERLTAVAKSQNEAINLGRNSIRSLKAQNENSNTALIVVGVILAITSLAFCDAVFFKNIFY